MRPVYLILAHSRPRQLRRLVEVLRTESPACSVVVHWDAGAPPLDLAGLDDVHLVADPADVEWGGYGILDATLRGLRAARERIDFDWLVLLSGQDYPIAAPAEFEAALARSGADALLDRGRVVERRPPWRRADPDPERLVRRYWFAYRSLPPERVPRAVRRAALALDRRQPLISVQPTPAGLPWYVGRRRARTPFGPAMPCRKGANWFSLSSRAVDRVLEATAPGSALVRHYRRTILPDESLVQTLLCADGELVVRQDESRYVRWGAEGSPHPDVLTTADLPAMLASGRHFARKFAEEVDAEVLDRIDEHRWARKKPDPRGVRGPGEAGAD